MLRPFGLALLCLGTPAAAEGPCDLGPWLHEAAAPGEEGYHVLCAATETEVHVYRGGVATDTPQLLVHRGEDLREQLAKLLKIRRRLSYRAHGKAKPMQWRKQPWALYTDDGVELLPGEEAAAVAGPRPRTLLLFEGGIWRWPTMRVGYERRVLPNVVLRTVARQPALFEVLLTPPGPQEDVQVAGDRLSTSLLTDVISVAKPRLEPSMTEGSVNTEVRSSEQTFLDYGSDPKLSELQRLTSALLRAPMDNLWEFQVLRYKAGQHYDAHRDYWDPREFPQVQRFTNSEGFWTMRHATLLWYLQAPGAGGETWFPRAHGGGVPHDDWMACDGRGVKVVPANATAVLFYNLRSDGDIDEYSWHCGCPVKRGVKWAANSWLSNTPSRPRAWLHGARERRADAGPEL